MRYFEGTVARGTRDAAMVRVTSRRRSAAALLVASIGLLGPVLFAPRDTAAEPLVEVRKDQTTTVIGTFDSLADLLRRLCAQAGVELRSYDAPDRVVTVQQIQRPLGDVIETLLSRENYLLGVREPRRPGQFAEVGWIRVTGSRASDVDVVAGGIAAPAPFGTHEFDDESPDQTRRARRAVADRLTGDPDLVAQLLATNPAQLARSLRQYPHIADLLREIRAQQPPAVQRKLDAVIAELGKPAAPED